MRNIFTIHGIRADGSRYAVVAYDSVQECKRHFVKLEQFIKARNEGENTEVLSKYDQTGNSAEKYIVTKVMSHANLRGFEWFNRITGKEFDQK